MVTSYWSFLMDGDVLPHKIIRCGMQRAQSSPCTMPVQYNAMSVQCNAMVAQRTRPCTILWLQGRSARRTCGACGACGAWIKESQRVSFELCVEARILESVFVRRRKNLATWLIYYSGCTPLHTMTTKDLENRYCEIWFIWCILQFQ